MKPIDDALSGSWVRSAILSGILLTAGIHPLSRSALAPLLDAFALSSGALLLIEVIFFGLVVSSAGTWIYYLYEGFALRVVTVPARRWNERRLRRLCGRESELQKNTARSPEETDELDVLQDRIRDYPLVVRDGLPVPEVRRPTLLANIIETYELYPATRYGLDGIVFWYHLLAKAPDGIRADFDDQYAFAQGLLLTSFSAAIVAILYAAILSSVAIGSLFPGLIVGRAPLSLPLLVAFMVAGAILSVVFYRLSIPAHRETGRVFRSLVDLSAPAVITWLDTAPTTVDTKTVERSTRVRQFLRSLIQSSDE